MNRTERVFWQPWVPAAMLAFFVYRSISAGLTTYRVFAIVWMGLWFALAVYDKRSGGRLSRLITSSGRRR